MRLRLLAVSSLVALAGTMPAMAQDRPEQRDSARGNDIIVTATRSALPANALPLTINVIGKDTLDQQIAIAGSVTDAVANLTPSFSPTRQKLSGAGETLRGRSPLYAINGIPQSTPLRDGGRDGFTIDGFFVDRVEVIYGANALQGIGGTGGIVNQVTVGPPKDDGISGRVLVQGSADDGFHSDGLGGKVAGMVQYKADRFDATVGATFEKRGAYYDGDGRRAGISLTQGETQDSRTYSVFGRFGYQLGDSARIDLIANHYQLEGEGNYVAVAGDRETGLPTSAERGTPPGVSARNQTDSVALSVTDPDLGGGNFVSQIYYNRSRDTFGGEFEPIDTFQDPALAPIGTLFDQSQNRSRKIGGKISYERAVPGFEDLTLTAGFDALQDKTEQRLIATNRVWVPPVEFRSLAPFGQANLKLFNGLVRVAGGARWENVQIKIDDFTTLASANSTFVSGGKPKFDDVLFNGGVIVEPVPGIRAYASYAEGFTVPDVGRVARSINRPGQDVDTLLDISPIIANNREIGVELKRGPLDAAVTYFWSSSDKGQLLIARPGGIYDVQRQRVEIEGLEITVGLQTPIEGLRLSLGYADMAGRYDADEDGRVDTDLDGVNISPDRLNLGADFVSGPFSARVQTQVYFSRKFQSELPGELDPRNDFGGYTLTDAYLGYQTSFGALSFSVQNLFNKQYIDYSSDTRRPDDDFSYFAGRGRVFTLGWDYRF